MCIVIFNSCIWNNHILISWSERELIANEINIINSIKRTTIWPIRNKSLDPNNHGYSPLTVNFLKILFKVHGTITTNIMLTSTLQAVIQPTITAVMQVIITSTSSTTKWGVWNMWRLNPSWVICRIHKIIAIKLFFRLKIGSFSSLVWYIIRSKMNLEKFWSHLWILLFITRRPHGRGLRIEIRD